MLGHSLVEYSALCSINCINLCSGANILRKRGDAMQNAVRNIETSMVAVIGMDLEIIEKEINRMNKKKNEICEVANDNCPGQVILSGTKGSVDFISQKLKSLGARSIIELNVSAPFHCSLMKNATMVMQDALSEVVIQKPKIKFINNVNAKFVYNPEEIKKLLVEQVQSRVRWRESIGEASRLNLDFIIEIGPGRVLTGLNKRMKVDAGYFSISTLEDINNFQKTTEMIYEKKCFNYRCYRRHWYGIVDILSKKFNLILVARNEEKLEQLSSKNNSVLQYIKCDLSNPNEIKGLIEKLTWII